MAFFNHYPIKDFAKERYLELVRSHPKLAEEKTQLYIMLILTFSSMSILGAFAINPTLTTIAELNRKLSDSTYVNEALQTKVSNLSSLNSQYQLRINEWSILESAVPNDPKVVMVLGQLRTIAANSNVVITDLQSYEVEISNPDKKKPPVPRNASYIVSVTAEGNQDNLSAFVKNFASSNRISAIEEISYFNEDNESVNIRARLFFTP
jgi:Tfp pilus assembly protein PilO